MQIQKHDPDQMVLDEVAAQVALNSTTEEIVQLLAPLDVSQRAWVMGQMAERYCPLCGRVRERFESGILRRCSHGDRA